MPVLEAFDGGFGIPEAFFGPGGGPFRPGGGCLGAALCSGGLTGPLSFGHGLSGGGGGFGDAFPVVGRTGPNGGGIFIGGPASTFGGGPVVT